MTYRYKNKQADQWLIIESLEIGLIMYGQLIFYKCTKTITKKRLVFATNDTSKKYWIYTLHHIPNQLRTTKKRIDSWYMFQYG